MPTRAKIWTPPMGSPRPYVWAPITWLLYNARRRVALLRRRGHLRRAALREARRDRDRARAEPAAGVHGGRRHRSARQRPLRTRSSWRDAKAGSLPAVSWVMPVTDRGEHPPDSIEDGPGVRREADQLGDARPRGAVAPHRDLPDVGRLGRLLRPREASGVDENGWGLRVPSMVISPWAQAADTSTTDVVVRRVSEADRGPVPGGRPARPADERLARSRPTVREDVAILGDLAKTSTSTRSRSRR